MFSSSFRTHFPPEPMHDTGTVYPPRLFETRCTEVAGEPQIPGSPGCGRTSSFHGGASLSAASTLLSLSRRRARMLLRSYTKHIRRPYRGRCSPSRHPTIGDWRQSDCEGRSTMKRAVRRRVRNCRLSASSTPVVLRPPLMPSAETIDLVSISRLHCCRVPADYWRRVGSAVFLLCGNDDEWNSVSCAGRFGLEYCARL